MSGLPEVTESVIGGLIIPANNCIVVSADIVVVAGKRIDKFYTVRGNRNNFANASRQIKNINTDGVFRFYPACAVYGIERVFARPAGAECCSGLAGNKGVIDCLVNGEHYAVAKSQQGKGSVAEFRWVIGSDQSCVGRHISSHC